MTKAATLLRVLIVVTFLVSSALAQILVEIRTAHARARSKPTSDSKTIATLSRGDSFLLVEDLPYWYGIELENGQKAYVAKSACRVLREADVEEEDEGEQDAVLPASSWTQARAYRVPQCTPAKLNPDWTQCPTTGTGGAYAAAYRQKNRVDIPCEFKQLTVSDLLSLPLLPKNVRSLSGEDAAKKFLEQIESTPIVVEGYFAMTKMAGKEGVNCHRADRRDLRMELVNDRVDDPNTTRRLHIVAEATPWFQVAHVDWSVADLRRYSSYTGGFTTYRGPPAKVRIFGFPFFDEAHAYDGSVGRIRGTPWEIHPVVRIEVLEGNRWKEVR